MATRGNSTRTAHASSKATLDRILQATGTQKFRDHQLKVLRECGIEGRDMFAQIACGEGKTTGFICALITRCQANGGGIGILSEPTVALIFQLVDKLESLAITVLVLEQSTRHEACNLLLGPKPLTPTVIIGRPEELVHPDIVDALSPHLTQRVNFETYFPVSPVVLFCVDEAHLVVQWSVGFLKWFGMLGLISNALSSWPGGRCSILAYTGTATALQRIHIKKSLKFRRDVGGVVDLICTPRRGSNNIFYNYRVSDTPAGNEKKNDKMKCIMKSVRQNHVVLVYCSTVSRCTQLVGEWNTKLKNAENGGRKGLCCDMYTGTISKTKRRDLVNRFSQAAVRCAWERSKFRNNVNGACDDRMVILFCTTSFAMGVDVYGIERVVIYDMTRNLNTTIQEASRAGRAPDSTCMVDIFFNWKKYLVLLEEVRELGEEATSGGSSRSTRQRNDTAAGGEQKVEDEIQQVIDVEKLEFAENAEAELSKLYALAVASECRKQSHEKHFGIIPGDPCNNCNWCRRDIYKPVTIEEDDVLEEAIRQTFVPYSTYGVTEETARKQVKNKLPPGNGRTLKVIAARLHHFVTSTQELKMSGGKSSWKILQGRRWKPPVAVAVEPLAALAVLVAGEKTETGEPDTEGGQDLIAVDGGAFMLVL